MGMVAGSCDFNGVATITTIDPSKFHFPLLENLMQNLVLLCRETFVANSASHFLLFTNSLLQLEKQSAPQEGGDKKSR